MGTEVRTVSMLLGGHVDFENRCEHRHSSDRRLHVPKGKGIKISDSLKDVVLADISIEDIEEGWMEFNAVCDPVAAGRISAVLACERFGSASRGEKAYKAGHAYGLLLRALHLCDTLTLEEFRRETLRALNHNEKMQATLDRWRAQGREIDPQILHHTTPMGFEGINFGGILGLPRGALLVAIAAVQSATTHHDGRVAGLTTSELGARPTPPLAACPARPKCGQH